MPEHDRIIANEHLLDHQAYEALTLEHVERVGGHTQSREKCRERLGELQVGGPLAGLIADRLQLRSQRLLTLAQGRHPLPQLFKREEVFLVRGQDPFDALPDSLQIAPYHLFASGGGIRGTRDREASIKLLLNQRGIFEQSNDLGPDDRIQQVIT